MQCHYDTPWNADTGCSCQKLELQFKMPSWWHVPHISSTARRRREFHEEWSTATLEQRSQYVDLFKERKLTFKRETYMRHQVRAACGALCVV